MDECGREGEFDGIQESRGCPDVSIDAEPRPKCRMIRTGLSGPHRLAVAPARARLGGRGGGAGDIGASHRARGALLRKK
jgi:hypothetical protein